MTSRERKYHNALQRCILNYLFPTPSGLTPLAQHLKKHPNGYLATMMLGIPKENQEYIFNKSMELSKMLENGATISFRVVKKIAIPSELLIIENKN